MARPSATLSLAALMLLAGCSGGPGDDAVSTTAPTFTVTAQEPPVAKLTTDTYHLLARPDMTAQAPTASEPLREHIYSTFETATQFNGAPPPTWNTTLLQDLDGFVGNATLVVEVTGTLYADPRTNLQPGCFWNLAVAAGPYETSTEYKGLGCVKSGPQVPPGIYVLSFPFTLAEVKWTAGTQLRFDLGTYEPLQRAPGANAELLTASTTYDSTIQVYGLQLPVDPTLVLQTTT